MTEQNPISFRKKVSAIAYALGVLVKRRLQVLFVLSGMLCLGLTVKAIDDERYQQQIDAQIQEVNHSWTLRLAEVQERTKDQLLQRDTRINEQLLTIKDLRDSVGELTQTTRNIARRQSYQIQQRKKEVITIQKAADKATDAAAIVTKGVSDKDRQLINQAVKSEVKK